MAKLKSTADKITPRLDVQKMKSLGILSFDFDNKYPQRVKDIVKDSPTASSVLRIYRKFVKGRGIADTEAGYIKVNRKGLTINKLLGKLAGSKGELGPVAVHFNYNALGEKVEIQFIPAEYCRLTDPDGEYKDKIAVYDDWGGVKSKNVQKNKIKYIDRYNPSELFNQVSSIQLEDKETKGLTPYEVTALKWKKYNGQILYWSPDGSEEYTLSPFDPVLEEMQTEAQTKRFKNNTSAKNFLASHLIITNAAETDEDEEDFINNMKEFQGGDGSGTMFWLQRKNADEQIELKKVDIQNYDGLYDYTETSARSAIHRIHLVPPVLLLETSNGIGESKELSDATTYYNNVTALDRDELTELLYEIFSGSVFTKNREIDFTILTIKYSDVVAYSFDSNTMGQINAILTANSLSLEQKKGSLRVLYGINEQQLNDMLGASAEGQDTGKVLAIEFGVGGTTNLVNIVSSAELSPDQKKGIIGVLFGLTDEQLNKMLPLPIVHNLHG